MQKAYKNWGTLILYRMNILPGAITVQTRDDCKIMVRPRNEEKADVYVANETWLYGIHDALLPYMKNAKVGIDIGAHIGTFSVWAARHSSAKIYAFEPAEKNISMLEKNIRLNGLQDRVEIVPKVVSSETGKKKLYITENSGLISTVEEHTKREDAGKLLSSDMVDAISLGDFFKEKKIDFCDFMKVDIESGEYDLFMNLPDEVYAKIGAMSIEIGNNPAELIQHIVRKGFIMLHPNKDFGEYIFIRK